MNPQKDLNQTLLGLVLRALLLLLRIEGPDRALAPDKDQDPDPDQDPDRTQAPDPDPDLDQAPDPDQNQAPDLDQDTAPDRDLSANTTIICYSYFASKDQTEP